MAKRLFLIDAPPGDHGQKAIRYALEDVIGDYSFVNLTPGEEIIKGYQYFEAIKPALIGRQNVVIEGSWYRRPWKQEDAELQMLERAALSCGFVHIICRPGMFRGEQKDLQRVEALISSDYDAVVYDSASMLCQDPRRFVQQFVLPAMDFPCAPEPYLGRWLPRAIALVSDKPKFKGFNAPFISFREDGVSWWLADAMARANLDESHFVWVNCQDADGVETDPDPLLRLQPTICLAMGTNAAEWCRRANTRESALVRFHGPLAIAEHKTPIEWKTKHRDKMYPLISDCRKLVEAMR